MILAGPARAATVPELDGIRAMVRSGELQDAITRLDSLLEREPKDPKLRFLKGVALAEQGKVGPAIEVFESLTVDFPSLPEPHNNLAVLYASKGDYEKARSALLVAINTHPSYATAHENLGDIYAKMARIAYDRALSLNNRNRTAQAKLDLLRDLFSVRDTADASVPAAVTQTASGPGQEASSPPATPPKQPVPTTPPRMAKLPEEAVVSTVRGWAAAWSGQDVDGYLSFYDERFDPGSGLSRLQWAAQRRVRLKRPGFIEVKVSAFQISPRPAGGVVVIFKQDYRSDSYKDSVTKRLELVSRPKGLRIVSERAVP